MLNCYQITIGALAKKTALLQTLICGSARGVCKCAVLCDGRKNKINSLALHLPINGVQNQSIRFL